MFKFRRFFSIRKPDYGLAGLDLNDTDREFKAPKKSKLDLLRSKIKMIIMIKSAYSSDPKQKLRPMDKEE